MAADFQTGSTYDWAVNELARNLRSSWNLKSESRQPQNTYQIRIKFDTVIVFLEYNRSLPLPNHFFCTHTSHIQFNTLLGFLQWICIEICSFFFYLVGVAFCYAVWWQCNNNDCIQTNKKRTIATWRWQQSQPFFLVFFKFYYFTFLISQIQFFFIGLNPNNVVDKK